jgi:hypothetical protein
MLGRTRAVFLALLVTQLAGCCCCHRHCFRPYFNRRVDGCAAPCDGCSSCYGPAPLAAAPIVPIPTATAAPPPATGTSIDGKMTPIPSFNASIYGTSRVR